MFSAWIVTVTLVIEVGGFGIYCGIRVNKTL